MKLLLLPLFISVLPFCDLLAQSPLSGRVTDTQGAALVGATVLLTPDSILQSTGIDGQFVFQDLSAGRYEITVRYIGYQTTRRSVVIRGSKPSRFNIRLPLEETLLELITVTEEHAKQESSLAADHLSARVLSENRQGTFAEAIEQLPGINAINVGVGIAKPVIRGLSSNRIIVNQQGIKQESHQWGSDHGLEVDAYDVEQVEIIKGPASLQYGSDGLGGVINIMPGRIPEEGHLSGSLEGVHKTNNGHWGGSALLATNINGWFASARYSRHAFGDYVVPATQFIYNTFTLPIENNQLKNTAGQESNLRVSAGLQRDWGITRILYGHYSLDAGLFSGAVGIPRSYALTDDGNSRDLDVPKQMVDHYRISLHQTLFFGEDHLDWNVGYQENQRREFSFPEFHSIPSSQIDPGNNLALAFNLRTWSTNVHYERKGIGGRKMIFGVNAQWQDNQRSGFEFLLPDFRTLRSGVFALSEWKWKRNWIFNGGVRMDYANNDTDFFRQWVWNSNEQIIDSLIAPLTQQEYLNWSASVGSHWQSQDQRWVVKANLGRSFRVPYPAETVSNGIHHGTFRHEVGTPDLESEHGYQLDLGTNWKGDRFEGGLATYFNYFNNYIYLGPTFPARFSTLPEAGQIFQYRQDDAVYTGFELQWNWRVLDFLSVEQTADFVQSYNPETRLALPFTPQPTLKHRLRFHLPNSRWLRDGYAEVAYEYYFAAEGPARVDRSEQATPAYQLWSAGMGVRVRLGKQWVRLNVQGQNLANVFYLNHLSRYRLINVPEQGRNVVMSVEVPFSAHLRGQKKKANLDNR